MSIDLKKMSTSEIIELYPEIIQELTDRDVIQSKNLVGEIGEYLAISHYQKKRSLPTLTRADPSTKNYDALSKNGKRYAIKSTSGNTTGSFWGLNKLRSKKKDKKVFDYAIVVKFDKNYNLVNMYEITWNKFLKFKRWHSRMNTWNLSITSELKKEVKTML